MDHTLKIVVRAETKPNEKRAPITPEDSKCLLQAGVLVEVEASDTRVFKDEEYLNMGCKIVDLGSWKKSPSTTYVLGLKELDEEDSPICQKHIYFAHCYKGQSGWKELMKRFSTGGGEILDVEFMVDEQGRRSVAEFSPVAGFAGCAVAISIWCKQVSQRTDLSSPVLPYESEGVLIGEVKDSLSAAKHKLGRMPRLLVMGALGRCGKGARRFADAVGVPPENIALWDLEETKAGGPFKELLNYDILINCIFLGALPPGVPVPPPFLTRETIDSCSDRKLTVICDVSCDIGNPNNPLPFIDINTTFNIPVKNMIKGSDSVQPLDITSIDHLPSMLPRESSEKFSQKMLPHLLDLRDRSSSVVWASTAAMFGKKLKEL